MQSKKRNKASRRGLIVSLKEAVTLGRVLVFIVAAVAAYFAFISTFEMLYADRNPILARKVAGSSSAEVRLWTLKGAGKIENYSDASVIGPARKALRANPLNAEMLQALAFHYRAVGKIKKAQKLADLAAQITRRDRLNQLLLAQLAAENQNVNLAMEHLATALTVSSQGREQIFPILTQMMPNREFRRTLARLGGRNRDWMDPFLLFAMRQGGDNPAYVAKTLLEAKGSANRAAAKEVGADLLIFLANAGEADLARRIFDLNFGKDAENLLQSVAITKKTSDKRFGLLGWTPVENGASGAQLGKTQSGTFGALVYAESGQTRTPVMRRALFLDPGEYVLSVRQDRLTGDDRATLEWQIKCHGGKTWRTVNSFSVTGGSFAVTKACPMQMLELDASTSRSGQGIEVVLDGVNLRRN